MTVFNDTNKVELSISKVNLQSNAILKFICESKIVKPISGITLTPKSSEMPEWKIQNIKIFTHGVEYNFHTDLWLPDIISVPNLSSTFRNDNFVKGVVNFMCIFILGK